jgi:hypothetical protein
MNQADALLAASLKKLWPHRQHESNWLKNLFCQFGMHRWRELNLGDLVREKEVRYCFWCSQVRVNGVIYKV